MRVLRVLAYDGDEEWIGATLRHSIEYYECPKGTIKELIVIHTEDKKWRRPPTEVRNERSSPASSTGYRTSSQRGDDAE